MDRAAISTRILFTVGPVPISDVIVVTWVIMAALALGSFLSTRRLSVRPGPGQAMIELVVTGIAAQIEDAIRRPAAPFLPLIATLFIFLVVANLSLQLPGVVAPTARLETAAALALIVFFAAHVYGIRSRGVKGYLGRYLKPNPLLLPLNILSELTRTLSLTVRLFGNIMSHQLIIALLVAIAGLLVPIPIMALGILIGLVQAYIFSVLATLFLGAAVGAFESH
ncbi:MAG: F0F1 ATP synthase subunit A [Rhodospirillales bacterium]